MRMQWEFFWALMLRTCAYFVLGLTSWCATGSGTKTAPFLISYKVSSIRLCRKYHSSKDLVRNMYRIMHTAQSKPASNNRVQFITPMNVRLALFLTWAVTMRQELHLGPASTWNTLSGSLNLTFLQNGDIGVLAGLRLGLFTPVVTYLIQTAPDDSVGSEHFSPFENSSPLSNVRFIYRKIHEHNLDCVQAKQQRCHLQYCVT